MAMILLDLRYKSKSNTTGKYEMVSDDSIMHVGLINGNKHKHYL